MTKGIKGTKEDEGGDPIKKKEKTNEKGCNGRTQRNEREE